MSSNNIGRNRTPVLDERQKLNRLKTEAASEIGLNDYENIDKGNLSSRQNGSVGGKIGGSMVKRIIESYEQSLK